MKYGLHLVMVCHAKRWHVGKQAAPTRLLCRVFSCGSSERRSVGHGAGDSEAVLERDGEAQLVAAAASHRPDDPEELARIQAKGGRVDAKEQRIVSPSGQAGLNMSRSLGDPMYKCALPSPRCCGVQLPPVRRES